jgi:hypothetical protein
MDLTLLVALGRLSLQRNWVPGTFRGGTSGWQPQTLSRDLETSSSWNPQGFLFFFFFLICFCICSLNIQSQIGCASFEINTVVVMRFTAALIWRWVGWCTGTDVPLELAFSIFRENQEIVLRLWRLHTYIHRFIFHNTGVFKVNVVTSWKWFHDFTKKVKFSRYRSEQAQRVDRGIALSFLDPGARRGWMVSTTSRPLYPRERPGTQYTGGWVGPRAGLDVCEKSRPHRDSIPGPSSP